MIVDVAERKQHVPKARWAWPRRHEVVVAQLAMPSYRQEFVRALAESGEDIVLLVGDKHFGDGVYTDVESPIVRRTGRNVWFFGGRAVWQRGCLVRGFLAKNLVMDLGPRDLTSWLLLLSRIATFRKTWAWGHAHSRRGSHPDHNRLRRVMQGMCSALITYTETEAAELQAFFPDMPISPARNSLYSAAQVRAYELPAIENRLDLIIIGRLVADKKPILGLTAFRQALPTLPEAAVLHVIGSGSQEAEVRRYIESADLTERVRIHGWVSDLAELAPLFLRSRGLISPGYVGLNVTQALGFGVPVIYPRDDPHSPELEALDDTNSIVFDTDDVDQCSRAISSLYEQDWPFDCERIAKQVLSEYSTERMIEPFVALARRT